MRKSMRQSVRTRYNFCCGYCGVTETDIGSEMTVDHFHPRAHGGTDTLDNLVYCCHACNEFKGDYRETESTLRLLRPFRDNKNEHYREQENGMLFALTERGANHIHILRLNREKLIQHRLREQARTMQERRYQEMQRLIAEMQQTEADNQSRIAQTRFDADA